MGPFLHLSGGRLTSWYQARGFTTQGLSFPKCIVGIIKEPESPRAVERIK